VELEHFSETTGVCIVCSRGVGRGGGVYAMDQNFSEAITGKSSQKLINDQCEILYEQVKRIQPNHPNILSNI